MEKCEKGEKLLMHICLPVWMGDEPKQPEFLKAKERQILQLHDLKPTRQRFIKNKKKQKTDGWEI